MGVGDETVVEKIDEPADVALLELGERVTDDINALGVIERAPASLRSQERLLYLRRELDVIIE
jgi:trimethylamine:corrinoid methyltransferase-like protein